MTRPTDMEVLERLKAELAAERRRREEAYQQARSNGYVTVGKFVLAMQNSKRTDNRGFPGHGLLGSLF